MKDINCTITARSEDEASVNMQIDAGDAGMFALTAGLRGIVTAEESEEAEIFLVNGELPMTDEKWFKLILGQQLEVILPYLVFQTD